MAEEDIMVSGESDRLPFTHRVDGDGVVWMDRPGGEATALGPKDAVFTEWAALMEAEDFGER